MRLNKQDINKELLLSVATLLVISGSTLLPEGGEVGSTKELLIGIGLILLGIGVYIGRGYYKKKNL
jgi:hypothetical protein